MCGQSTTEGCVVAGCAEQQLPRDLWWLGCAGNPLPGDLWWLRAQETHYRGICRGWVRRNPLPGGLWWPGMRETRHRGICGGWGVRGIHYRGICGGRGCGKPTTERSLVFMSEPIFGERHLWISGGMSQSSMIHSPRALPSVQHRDWISQLSWWPFLRPSGSPCAPCRRTALDAGYQPKEYSRRWALIE